MFIFRILIIFLCLKYLYWVLTLIFIRLVMHLFRIDRRNRIIWTETRKCSRLDHLVAWWIAARYLIVIRVKADIYDFPGTGWATYIYWQSTHVWKCQMVRPIAQELTHHSEVFIVGCPMCRCHLCISSCVVCLCTILKQIFDDGEPGFICILCLALH